MLPWPQSLPKWGLRGNMHMDVWVIEDAEFTFQGKISLQADILK